MRWIKLACLLHACAGGAGAEFCVRTGHDAGYCVYGSVVQTVAVPWRTNRIMVTAETNMQYCSIPAIAARTADFCLLNLKDLKQQCYGYLTDNLMSGTLPTFDLYEPGSEDRVEYAAICKIKK